MHYTSKSRFWTRGVVAIAIDRATKARQSVSATSGAGLPRASNRWQQTATSNLELPAQANVYRGHTQLTSTRLRSHEGGSDTHYYRPGRFDLAERGASARMQAYTGTATWRTEQRNWPNGANNAYQYTQSAGCTRCT